MKNRATGWIVFAVACAAASLACAKDLPAKKEDLSPKSNQDLLPDPVMYPFPMAIVSSAFAHGGEIPRRYTCDGENVSPPLAISHVPIFQGAKTLALVVDDPDAPGKTWVHWVLYNISPNVQSIGEASVPPGGFKPLPGSPGPTSLPMAQEGMTDFGKPGYGGPCPPSGTHRYFFKLYALDTWISADKHPTASELDQAMKGHVMARAEWMGVYKHREK